MFQKGFIEKPPNPVAKTCCLNRLFFIWMIDIFRVGLKRTIDENDIYAPLDEHESTKISNYFANLWREELKKKKKPSLMSVLFKAYGPQVLVSCILFSISESIMKLLQPICLGGLVSYFAPGQTDIPKENAYLYAFGIFGTTIFLAIIFHPFIFYIFQVALKVNVGCCFLMYQKILKLSKSTAFDGMNGQVINMMSTDIAKIENGLSYFHDLWKGPMEVTIMGYYLYREIGISAIVGIIFILSFIPLQVWIGKKSANYHLKAAKRTDIRVKFMNEIIQGIQMIKMYAWEKSFAAMVDQVRRKEISAIRGSAYLKAGLFSFMVIARIAIFLSLISYIYFGQVITARKVYIVSSLFMALSDSMVLFWPISIAGVMEASVSIKRIENFLTRPESKMGQSIMQTTPDKPHANGVAKSEELTKLMEIRKFDGNTQSRQEIGVTFKNVTAIWSMKEVQIGIFQVNLDIKPNSLTAIIGPVGCGKSTILNIIIGELDIDSGTVDTNGTLSYASQDHWLFDGTIRQNIIFIEAYDAKRYGEVCRVCCLERDFEQLPYGDLTLVGERGVSLSGGQKARISLARAVYKKADIYLLDDPLSAVDSRVGKQIFTECISEFLKDKSVVLVTHQLQFLNNVKQIVLMENGRIDAQGPFEELKTQRRNSIVALTTKEETDIPDDNFDEEKLRLLSSNKKINEEEEEDIKELLTEGSVSMTIYINYFKSIKNKCTFVFVGILFFFSQLAITGIDYFLAQWVNWEESVGANRINSSLLINSGQPINQLTSNLSFVDSAANPLNFTLPNMLGNTITSIRRHYIIVYSVLIGVLIYSILHRNFAFYKMCLKASIKLHDTLFRSISRAKMYFFNNNPSGRILNRFSKDIGTIDSQLPFTLIESARFCLEMIATGFLITTINLWLLIPTAALGILLFWFRYIYIKTSRGINRIQALSRSPIYAHTNATIQGLSTIRAFKAQKALCLVFNLHQNNNTSPLYLFKASTRSFAIWLDTLCAVYVAVVTFSCLTVTEDNLSGDVGLIVSKSIFLIGLLQWGLRQSAELEINMISVERISEYSKLPTEPPLETLPQNQPSLKWPEHGAIVFNKLSLRYSEKAKPVLKNLTFEIKAKEKVGIVGRTGAGKSSIIQALFRLAEISGTIEIDGVATQKIGLHDLRNKIAIIPQDPILFSGTMRSNLDPFHEKSDDEMWNSLEQVQMKHAVSCLDGALDCKISNGGKNLSMGQRQLICLARAILRNNKILVLDEATANVDPDTDKLIQVAIRTKFSECTVLTIAHRLNTVMDSDRILVIEAGEAVEFDTPNNLLTNPDGYFSKLVQDACTINSNVLNRLNTS